MTNREWKAHDHGLCAVAWGWRWGCDLPRGHEGPHYFVEWMFDNDPAPFEMNYATREHQTAVLFSRWWENS